MTDPPDDSRAPSSRETESSDHPIDDFLKRGLVEVFAGAGFDRDRYIGWTIGSYRILDLLGDGGFGAVYLAERREPHVQRVALKVIKPGMDTPAVIARFEQERQALAVMDHPHVAKVFDAGTTDDGRPYFVMEYVQGDRITTYCDREKLSLRDRIEVFIPVCEAVQHAHHKGIIHRDLKPGNVLLAVKDGKPLPKVIDFGVAKAIHHIFTGKTIFTEQNQLIGTPEYMSPEQAEMGPTDIDTRTDVYSLGVMLYELLSGHLPFDEAVLRAASFDRIRRIIREVDPKKPSTRVATASSVKRDHELSSLPSPPHPPDARHGIMAHPRTSASGGDAQSPASSSEDSIAARRRVDDAATLSRRIRGDLDWVVMKCLEKDRTRRYETASALAADLRRYLRNEPVEAGPPSASYRLRKFVRRNRGPVIAALLVLVTLILGLMGTSYGIWRTEEARADAQQRADEVERVAAFQERQLANVDAERMGLDIRQKVLDSKRQDLERANFSEADIAEICGQLDQQLAGVNFSSVALGALDRNVLEQALRAIEEEFSNHPRLKARLLQTIADLFVGLGLLDRAIQPQREALAIRKQILSPHDLDTLNSIGSTGYLLMEQHKLEKAEPYLREALEGFLRELGPDDPKTLIALNNMATLRELQGRLDEAEKHHRAALAGFTRVRGEDHPQTLISMVNLGFILESQNRKGEAEDTYRRVLDLARDALPEDHPARLSAMNNLALLLKRKGELHEAEKYFAEVLDIRRRVLGDDHTQTFTAINNMAGLLEARTQLDEAVGLACEAMRGRRRVLGDDHRETLTSINNVGFLLLKLGRLEDAAPYLQEASEGRLRILGEHDLTVASFHAWGVLLQQQGNFKEAEGRYRRALNTNVRLHGNAHPNTLRILDYLARFYDAWHEAESAAGHDLKAAECREEIARAREDRNGRPGDSS